jgi:hypothetical protein
MDARAERLARNEALYRDVNERLKDLGDSFSAIAQRAVFVCECGRSDCVDRISLTLREYEDVRQEPTHFFVKKGHEMPDVHDVVAESDRFTVVEKRPGGPAEFATEHDPRS